MPRVMIFLVALALIACTPATTRSAAPSAHPAAPSPAEPVANTFSNPIITGFAPDPSIVRVEEDFYLINSTFEYFPGIPVYHSRDLINWTLIGNALHNPAHADLADIPSSGGIHASTIRYHQGTFYVITTNVMDGKLVNFVLTATDPAGPWSGPIVIEGAPGIDPSLFFDDDGRLWYVGNHHPEDAAFPAQTEIWLQELDPEAFQLMGERHFLWRGCCEGGYAEGPHIYKRDGTYYLLIAEGGTSYNHSVSIAVADEITGPYQNNPRNPVLTHRNLSIRYPITGIGHADLVELADGRWYAVALAWREVEGEGLLGRETFLIPVIWEEESWWWKEDKITVPVFSPLTGKVELTYTVPFAGTVQTRKRGFRDDFDSDALHPEWNSRRSQDGSIIDLNTRPGKLCLVLGENGIEDRNLYSFVGIRQRDFEFEATTRMNFAAAGPSEEAGIILMQNNRASIRLVRRGSAIQLVQNSYGEEAILAEMPAPTDDISLRVRGEYLTYHFDVATGDDDWVPFTENIDGRALSVTNLRGFNYTGVYVGLYASSNKTPTDNCAVYEYFDYRSTSQDPDGWFHRQYQNMVEFAGDM